MLRKRIKMVVNILLSTWFNNDQRQSSCFDQEVCSPFFSPLYFFFLLPSSVFTLHSLPLNNSIYSLAMMNSQHHQSETR